MKRRVGSFYVDTEGVHSDEINELGSILSAGEEKKDYPDGLFSVNDELGFDQISLRDFLPEWLRVQQQKIEIAKRVMAKLGIDILEP